MVNKTIYDHIIKRRHIEGYDDRRGHEFQILVLSQHIQRKIKLCKINLACAPNTFLT